jgi:hypothetical protein
MLLLRGEVRRNMGGGINSACRQDLTEFEQGSHFNDGLSARHARADCLVAHPRRKLVRHFRAHLDVNHLPPITASRRAEQRHPLTVKRMPSAVDHDVT